MNNLRKIGLSALAGSLVSFSAGAAEMSVSGGAAIYFDDTNRGKATRGNGFYMGDSLNFSASGETDNGISVTVKYEIDGGTLDDHSIALGGDWGTLTFDGHGASSAMGAVDDMTPNAYEEAWDIIDTDGTSASGSPLVIGGGGGDNAFIYTSPSVSGAQFKMYYQNDGGAAAVSDFKPISKSKNKIKKGISNLDYIRLEKNPDILDYLSKNNKARPKMVVGFSAETENVIQNSKKKIKEKYCDLIIANDVSKKDLGFNSEYNEVSIIDKKGRIKSIQRSKKSYIANAIAKIILDKLLTNDKNIN